MFLILKHKKVKIWHWGGTNGWRFRFPQVKKDIMNGVGVFSLTTGEGGEINDPAFRVARICHSNR
jgi:hypothetical protein